MAGELHVELLRVPASTGEIATLYYEPRRSRNVCIVAGHGYSSSKHNLDFLCGFLAGHGFAVYSLDFPGHKLGASGGRLRTDRDLVDAMLAVVGAARSRGSQTVYLLGHSMGAQTALRAAAEDPEIAGAIAIATGYGRLGALELIKGKWNTDFRSGYVDGLTLPQLMVHADANLEEALPKLAGRPVLYVAARRDMMVNMKSVQALFERAPEPKTLEEIDSDHTNAGEYSRSVVLQWLSAMHERVSA